MNKCEKRRQDLLKYKNQPPAVHPRYGRVYQSLYDKPEKSTFGIRLLVAFVIFILFWAINDRKIQIGTVSNEMIIKEVNRDLFHEFFPRFVKRFEFFDDFRFFD